MGEQYHLADRPLEFENYLRSIYGVYNLYDTSILDNMWFIRCSLSERILEKILNESGHVSYGVHNRKGASGTMELVEIASVNGCLRCIPYQKADNIANNMDP